MVERIDRVKYFTETCAAMYSKYIYVCVDLVEIERKGNYQNTYLLNVQAQARTHSSINETDKNFISTHTHTTLKSFRNESNKQTANRSMSVWNDWLACVYLPKSWR